MSPTVTDWSGPALAVGGWLVSPPPLAAGVARIGPATASPSVLKTTTRTSYSTPFTRWSMVALVVPRYSPADSQRPPRTTRRYSTK